MYNDYNLCGISVGGMKRTEEEKRVKREERRKRRWKCSRQGLLCVPSTLYLYGNGGWTYADRAFIKE